MSVSKVLRTVLVFFIAFFVICSCTVFAKDGFSSRANLKSLANKYFYALAANDHSLMPFSPDVKYTENGVETKIGDGLWKTAGKVLMTRHLIDTYKCGTHTQAVIEEKNEEGEFRPILMGVRLQYENEKITEVESIIAREKEFAMKHTPRGGAIAVLETKDQDWEGILSIEERSSRLAMIAAADDYFDMFSRKPIYGTPFATPCHRWENGYMATKGGFF